jgi:hypothetical protein
MISVFAAFPPPGFSNVPDSSILRHQVQQADGAAAGVHLELAAGEEMPIAPVQIPIAFLLKSEVADGSAELAIGVGDDFGRRLRLTRGQAGVDPGDRAAGDHVEDPPVDQGLVSGRRGACQKTACEESRDIHGRLPAGWRLDMLHHTSIPPDGCLIE